MTARPAGPGSWLTHSEVHVVPLAQCSEPVQAPALVVVLEELHEACKERGDEGRRYLPAGSAPAQLRAAFAQSSSWPLGGRGWEKSQEKSPWAVSIHSQFSAAELGSTPGCCRQVLAQQARQHLLWYMEKERNWFLNIWYMSPSGLQREDWGV